MRAEAPLLQVEGLTAGYGQKAVLEAVDLVVSAGETVALVGANGAGKTTLMRALMGLLPPQAGTVCFGGRAFRGEEPAARVRRGLALSPEGRLVFPELSVADNLSLGAYALGLSARERRRRADDLLALFEPLGRRRAVAAGLLSGGEQQMVAMARALMAEPSLLLLDEPTLGLSPRMAEHVFVALGECGRRGIAILMAEQQAGLALAAAARGYVLVAGTIARHGPAAELLADGEVQRAFLGSA